MSSCQPREAAATMAKRPAVFTSSSHKDDRWKNELVTHLPALRQEALHVWDDHQVMPNLLKFPRTPHLDGSRLQAGDEDLEQVPFRVLMGQRLVVTEKVDGANVGISFDAGGRLWLQSRGHFLTGGPRERHFALFKTWTACHQASLRAALGDRYLLYGEWLYAKHTVFYDALPHYFLAFDVLDRTTGAFLSTERQAALLQGLPVVSVPVLHAGPIADLRQLLNLQGPSRYKSPAWRERLRQQCRSLGLDSELVEQQTDRSMQMEGLYVKHEADGQVMERYKYVRADFSNQLAQFGDHWLDRPVIPNALCEGVDLYGEQP